MKVKLLIRLWKLQRRLFVNKCLEGITIPIQVVMFKEFRCLHKRYKYTDDLLMYYQQLQVFGHLNVAVVVGTVPPKLALQDTYSQDPLIVDVVVTVVGIAGETVREHVKKIRINLMAMPLCQIVLLQHLHRLMGVIFLDGHV